MKYEWLHRYKNGKRAGMFFNVEVDDATGKLINNKYPEAEVRLAIRRFEERAGKRFDEGNARRAEQKAKSKPTAP